MGAGVLDPGPGSRHPAPQRPRHPGHGRPHLSRGSGRLVRGRDVVPVEALARGHGVVFRKHGFDVDDVTSATLTYSDGSVFGFDVCYMLPMGFPTTGQSIRFEVFGSEGALLIDDDHREQILYTEQGHQNAYAGDQEVNLYFLGSQSAGEWADGRMFGRVAEETRTWLDYLTAAHPVISQPARRRW